MRNQSIYVVILEIIVSMALQFGKYSNTNIIKFTKSPRRFNMNTEHFGYIKSGYNKVVLISKR